MVEEPQLTEIEKPETKREMGQIIALQYGYTEQNGIGLTFIVKLLERQIGLFLPADQVTDLILRNKITDISTLVRQTCVMEVQGNQLTFAGLV